MKTRKQILDTILDVGVVAIVRLSSGDRLLEVAMALRNGGLTVIEFTLNTPGAIEGIRRCSRELPDVLFGAGTVLNASAAEMAIDAGAQFIVSPDTKASVIEATHGMGKVSVPGAYTPTEIGHALELHADLIKLFPAKGLGPEYVKELRGPFDNLKIMPTGGVSRSNVSAYFRAGACAVAAGGSLVNDMLVKEDDLLEVTLKAKALRIAVDNAREEMVL